MRSAKKARFVSEYAIDLDATKAATRAGYSEKTAYSAGSRLLKEPEVAQAVKEELARAAERNALTVDWVMQRLKKEAEEAGSDSARVRALELLGKQQGMFKDRIEHSGPNGGPLAVDVIRRVIVDPASGE